MKYSARTGLAAIALIAGPVVLGPSAAVAQQQNFNVRISGDYWFQLAFVSQQKDADLRTSEARNRLRVVVQPEAKADNGLTYGARIQIRAAPGDRTTDADQVYAYAEDKRFGYINGGVHASYSSEWLYNDIGPDDYRVKKQYDNAQAFSTGTAAGQTVTGTRVSGADVRSIGTGSTLSTRVLVPGGTATTALLYKSPRLAGLELAFQYVPRSDSANTDVNRVKTAANSATSVQTLYTDLMEFGANYRRDLGEGVRLTLLGDYITGKSAHSTASTTGYDDVRMWELGGNIRIGDFAFGGAYLNQGTSGLPQARGTFAENNAIWHVSAQYNVRPLIVGAGFQRGRDAGSTTTPGSRRLDIVDAGIMYVVAPGMKVGVEYNYFTAKSDLTTRTLNRDDRGSVVLFQNSLVF